MSGGQRRLRSEVTFEGCEGMSHLDIWGEVLAGGVNTRTQVYPWPLVPETRQDPQGMGSLEEKLPVTEPRDPRVDTLGLASEVGGDGVEEGGACSPRAGARGGWRAECGGGRRAGDGSSRGLTGEGPAGMGRVCGEHLGQLFHL